jgi:protein-export membrane protein SecD
MIHIARWKAITILLVCLVGLIYAIPSLVPSERLSGLPEWLPHQQVTLGLDLQGGAHLLYEVDTKQVVRDRLTNLADAVRVLARPPQQRFNLIGAPQIAENAVTFRVRDAGQVEAARVAARELDQTAQITTGPNNTIVIRLDQAELIQQSRRAVQQSIEIVRRRIDQAGTKESTIQAQGSERILVQLPGERDPERIKKLIGPAAQMSFRLLDMNNPFPTSQTDAGPGVMIVPGDGKDVGPDGKPRLYAVQRRISVSGDRLVGATPGTNPQTGEWVINFKFDSVGTRQFADTTRDNVGRPFAIVLDGKVISAPVIREPILAGSGQISGSFNAATATDLAVLLTAGALPAPLHVIEERTVGPDLGSDSIRAGTIACLIGYALIAVLMVVGYGLFGLFANVALILNLAFTLAIMAAIGATLTLPGIAGMVLGLAMAVDANVLIYERMREEERNGRSPFPAIDVAFQRAYITIVDSNLTTLIAGLFLYMFGTGPVRGFAVTLSIGIICSMFTSVTVTRLLVVMWLQWRRPKQLPI